VTEGYLETEEAAWIAGTLLSCNYKGSHFLKAGERPKKAFHLPFF
jgi:hypothetical protein